MYRAVTRDIEVTVTPVYRPDESRPDEGRWFWAYEVGIVNGGPLAVQLLARHWVITDGHGAVQEVRGPGVVGQKPLIGPGERFDYASGCPLTTPSGFMQGVYRMVDERGEVFDVGIPAFPLDVPDARRVLN